MAGHSKWSKIKRKKEIKDKKKSIISSKLMNDIFFFCKESGSNPKYNFKLKRAIDKALENNISMNAITKIMNYTNLTKPTTVGLYTGMLKSGIVIITECYITNKNKISFELKCLFSKYNGNLVNINSVSYLFEKKFKVKTSNDIFKRFLFENTLLNNIDILSDNNNIIEFYIKEDCFILLKKKMKLKNDIFYYSLIMEPYVKIKLGYELKIMFNNLLNELRKFEYIKSIFTNVL